MNEQDKVVKLKMKLKNALSWLETKIGSRIEGDFQGYSKAIDVFEKHVERLPARTDSALQSSLSTFAGTFTEAISVTKRKKGKYINVQATSKSRRAIPLRGSRAAYFGAPRKDTALKLQLCVSANEEILAYKLVLAGRAAEKKH